MIKLDKSNIPTHIALIMDGNRRWAKEKGLDKFEGHKKGYANIEKTVQACMDLGVKYVTFWALSTDNLKEREKSELLGLFNLIRLGFNQDFPRMMKNGVQVRIIGESTDLPLDIKKTINKIQKTVVRNPKIYLNVAFNYSGKKEVIHAIKEIIKEGIQTEKVDEAVVEKHLYTYPHPDPDLIVRTGGKVRTSGYLIWQGTYAEWYFTEKYWPDFDERELKKAILWYQSQKRNFGK